MSIQLVGMNHKTAPVAIRERLALSDEDAVALAGQLAGGPRLDEALVLSTCNRVEFLGNGEPDELRGAVLRHLLDRLDKEALAEDALYVYGERAAVRHVVRVASSLDSMVVGEPQILGQVRDAYRRATDAGTLGGPLGRLISQALRVARRVRNETGIGRTAVSVSSVAVELARKIFGELDGLSVLLIGAGDMAEAAARHLRGAGASHLYVANRTFSAAESLAASFAGRPVRFERLLELLQRVDIVLSSTGSPGFVLTRRTAEGVIASRRNRPIFLVDIAVPRDIDPDINAVDNMFVYDIDDLQQVAEANLKHRRREAERAEWIVEHEVEGILNRLRASRAAPAIVSLNQRLEDIRRGELERYGSKLRGLTAEQRAAVEALTRGMISKIAHHPIREAKRRASDPRSGFTFDDFRRLFGLD